MCCLSVKIYHRIYLNLLILLPYDLKQLRNLKLTSHGLLHYLQSTNLKMPFLIDCVNFCFTQSKNFWQYYLSSIFFSIDLKVWGYATLLISRFFDLYSLSRILWKVFFIKEKNMDFIETKLFFIEKIIILTDIIKRTKHVIVSHGKDL